MNEMGVGLARAARFACRFVDGTPTLVGTSIDSLKRNASLSDHVGCEIVTKEDDRSAP